MDQLTDDLQKLSIGVEQGQLPSNCQDILTTINKLLSDGGTDKKVAVDFLVKQNIIPVFARLLKLQEASYKPSVIMAMEIVAEVAKTDIGRKQLSENVPLLTVVLELLSYNDSQLRFHACRALANISYDNDTARKLIREKNGIQKLITLLKDILDNDYPDNLRIVTSGCLLNLTETYEELQEQALQAGVLDVLLQYLNKFRADEDVVTHCLLVLSCLADSETGQIKILEKPILTNLLSMFDKPLREDILDALLELFGNLCERDDAKLQLAEIGLCDKLVQLIRVQSKPEIHDEHLNIHKLLSDLVVLILTGDASMEHVYQNGKGDVYKEVISWLKSENEYLCIAGALAAGNFARKDSHCIQMVKDGVAADLLTLLRKHFGNDGDIRMQHAILSALKNLAIPVDNKPVMVDLGIADMLIEMMDIETFPVVFKLLGTLRMLLDKQEGISCLVGENIIFVQRVVQWCSTDDHPGVQGEAVRLLAWLVKNSRSEKVIHNLLSSGALPLIVTMLKSEHNVMQIEALIAVTLTASLCLNDLEERVDIKSLSNGISNTLKGCPEVMDNSIVLLMELIKSDKLLTGLRNSQLKNDLKGLGSHSNERTTDLVKLLLTKLEK